MKKNMNLFKRILLMGVLLVFGTCAAKTVYAETYTATTMRLLKYEGNVEIEDETGASSLIMENIRFNSGDTLHTGTDGYASIGLDSSKIVSLDKDTTVGFIKESNAMEMELADGTIYLDVKEKLDENETLDIKTSNMTVGIRGTIVVLSEDGETGIATMKVFEGIARVTAGDKNGIKRVVEVPAGQKVVVRDPLSLKEGTVSNLEVKDMVQGDVDAFVEKEFINDSGASGRVEKILKQLGDKSDAVEEKYPEKENWEYTETVKLVAQSASKMYDGEPLTRTQDVLVYGLPADFNITVSAVGEQTDAGIGINKVDAYSITNSKGEDVTSHFKSIKCVDGELVVEKAPLTIWTSSAAKTYDGTPLVSPEAKLTFYAGYETGQVPWRNTSYVATQKTGVSAAAAGDEQVLYGVCGITQVHGTNPITGETKKIDIGAGQKLTVILHNEQGQNSIEFKVEKAAISEIPEEIIRMYADNADLLNTAAADAAWTTEQIEELNARIEKLKNADKNLSEKERTKTTDWNGLAIDKDQVDRMQADLTNVRVTIDTDVTNYNNRALGKEETHYTPVKVNDRIKLTATGSQTDVGISPNSYEIDWDGLEGNYEVTEELGTLTVTPASVTVTTGSAEKEYDGTPLTDSEASITGLVNGETASVTATGSITEAGTKSNTYDITWKTAKASNYTVSEDLGTLRVTKNNDNITFYVSVTGKSYDGKPLTGDSIKVEGLPSGMTAASVSVQSAEGVTVNADSDASGGDYSGYTYKVSVSGSVTDVGSAKCTIDSVQIFDPDGKDVTSQFQNIKTEDCTLTITPAKLTVITGSLSKEYDGTALTYSAAAISGLVNGETATAAADGSITDVGTAENTYSIEWGTAKESNYTITENLGTLEVTDNTAAVTFQAASAEKVYDGTALTNDSVTVTGLPSGMLYTADVSGSQTDAGSSDNTVASYKILNEGEEDVTSYFTNITAEKGTLTVTKAAATVTTGSASKEYDGSALTNSEASITGLVNDETATVTATGTITDVGTADNTYSIEWGSAKESNYTLTENPGTLKVTANTAAVIFRAASAEKVYDGTVLTNDSVTVTGLPSGMLYTADVSGSQTDAGSSDNTVASYKILNEGEEDVTSYFTNITAEKGTLTVTKAEATVTTGSSSKEYDGSALTNSEASITGLVNDETATVTATGTITDVGTADNTYSIEWGSAKESNYTITENLGTLEITEPEEAVITLIANGGESTVEYDGEYHGGNLTVECSLESLEYTLTKTSDTTWELAIGDEYTEDIEITGGGTDAGTYELNVACATVDISPVKLIYKTIGTTLEITPNTTPITFTSASAEKTYDGTPLTATTVTVEGLPSGFTYVASAGGMTTCVDAGTYSNGFTDMEYSVTDEDGNEMVGWRYYVIKNADGEDVTDNFSNVTTVEGTLKINPAAATVTTGSASKTYDGTALTSSEASITGLVNDETATVTATGTIKDAGTANNTYSISWGTAKETNYTLTENLGTLQVEALGIEFEVNSWDGVYDGNVHTPEGVTGTYADGTEVEEVPSGYESFLESYTMNFSLIGGATITLYDEGHTDAGTYDVTPTCTFTYGTPDNYSITYTNNEMTIEKATATITTGSAEGPSGTAYPVTCDEVSITGLADCDKDEVTVKATGECTSVGSTVNTYEIDWGEAKSSNYTIVENLGTLTMYNAAIPVSEESEGSVVSTPASQEAAADTDQTSGEPKEQADSDDQTDESKEKTVENTEEKSEEKSEEASEEKSEEASEEKAEEKSEEASEEKAEEKSEEVSEEKSEEKSEEVSEEKSEEVTEEKSEEKSEEVTEEKSGEAAEEKKEENSEVEAEVKTEEKSEEVSAEKTEE